MVENYTKDLKESVYHCAIISACDKPDKRRFIGFIHSEYNTYRLCLLTVMESIFQYNKRSSVYFTVLSPRLVLLKARLWPRFGKYSRFELQLQQCSSRRLYNAWKNMNKDEPFISQKV